MHRLVVEESGRSMTLDLAGDARVTVGRGRSSTVVLTDPSASRDHCAFEKGPDGLWLLDLGSRNGTTLNGKRVEGSSLLRPGDRIEIGQARLTIEDSEQPSPVSDLQLIDTDTGLLPVSAVRQELEKRLATRGSFALVKLDVDALGLVNSLLGYEAGDAVIGFVAHEASAAVREIDTQALVAHESGGKLLVLLPGHGAPAAAQVADKIRERVRNAARRGGCAVASVTLSAGVSASPLNGTDARSLLRAAESALEEAKRAGRDRAAIAAPEALRSTNDTIDTALEAASAPSSSLEPLLREPAGRSALALVGHALASDAGLEGLGELALGVVVRETGATRGLLVLRDETGELRLGAAVAPGAPRFAVAPASHGLLRAALASPDGILIDDAQADPSLGANESVAATGVRSVVAAPAILGDTAVAAIYLENNNGPGEFDKTHLELVRALARLIAGPIRRGLLHARALDELQRARFQLEGTLEEDARLLARYRAIVGRSAAIKKLLRSVDRVARRAVPVIIQGASGTGKELVARALHARSPWAKGPFVAENCAAISEELLEAELFGYRKGAFTGAEADRVGLLEAAHGGTLFLDEVGEMSPTLQAKLLRFLQEGELRRLGDQEVRRVTVRVVAATHRDLHSMVGKGEFREDLYYRLAVVQLEVPSLKERRDDIPLLVEHLAARASHELRRAVPRFTPEALTALAAYEWPGNVRQLENEIRKLIALGLDPVKPEHLSVDVRTADGGRAAGSTDASADLAAQAVLREVAEGRPYSELLDAVERRVIVGTLEATFGNRSEAARRLGFTRTGLRMKMRRLEIADTPGPGDGAKAAAARSRAARDSDSSREDDSSGDEDVEETRDPDAAPGPSRRPPEKKKKKAKGR